VIGFSRRPSGEFFDRPDPLIPDIQGIVVYIEVDVLRNDFVFQLLGVPFDIDKRLCPV
jgi:hypothetical protein